MSFTGMTEGHGKRMKKLYEITKFQGEHRFLSNFFPSIIVSDGLQFPSVEHAFQAAKTSNINFKSVIRDAETPAKANNLGRVADLREDWAEVREGIMLDLLRQKFADPTLRKLLIQTGERPLVEGNTWGDQLWGAVWDGSRYVGENKLGKLLMQVRKEINDLDTNS